MPTAKRDDDPRLRTLAPVKIAVFLHTISQAGWNRFSGVYMLGHGFTPSQIGRIKSTSQIAKVLAQPFWGIISDATDPFGVMVVSTIVGTLTLFRVRTAIDSQSLSDLIVWRMARSAATAASPAMNALILLLIEGTTEGYGKQRLWGSIAWGVSALFAGILLDKFGGGAIFVYTYASSALFLAFLFALRRILPTVRCKRREPKSEAKSLGWASQICSQAPNIWQDLCGSGSNSVAVWAIVIHNFCYGTMMVVFDSILMLQLERDFGMSRSVQGVFTAVSIASALPVYHYSRTLQKRIGHLGMIQSSIVVSALRLCFTMVACSDLIHDGSRAYWLLVLQLLHGYHFAANWVASVELLDNLASRKRQSLVQFILDMAYFTAGSGVGNLWFGLLYEEKGGQAVFSNGLCLCVVDFIIIWALKLYSTQTKFDTKESSEQVGLV